MSYSVERKAYPFIKGIRWDHVDRQREIEDAEGTYEDRGDTSLLVNCGYSEPGLLQNILIQMQRINYGTFHMYYSRFNEGETGGWHADDMDVLIIPSMGRIKYLFDIDGKVFALLLMFHMFGNMLETNTTHIGNLRYVLENIRNT